MQTKLMLSMTASFAFMLFQATPQVANAEGRAALTATVASNSRRRNGRRGRQRPKGRLDRADKRNHQREGPVQLPGRSSGAGKYDIVIRAVGYDLSGPTTADVTADGTTTTNLKLEKTKNLAHQLTNAEWIDEHPGHRAAEILPVGCAGCHTLERIVRSTHNADEFTQVDQPHVGVRAVSQPIKPQPMLDRTRTGSPEQYRKVAEYLETVNLSATPTTGSIRSRPCRASDRRGHARRS